MWFNEMYNTSHPTDHYLNPSDTAHCWVNVVQLVSTAIMVDLISPTLSAKHKYLMQFSNFLKTCYNLQNDTNHPCDNLIKVCSPYIQLQTIYLGKIL